MTSMTVHHRSLLSAILVASPMFVPAHSSMSFSQVLAGLPLPLTAGKRGRGRPARTWEKDIEEWAGTNIGEATRMAERRDLWCTVIDVTAAQH